MEKKENIPANAVWNPEDSHWELGNKNAEGKPIGSWKTWHTDGHQTSEIDYNNGTPPFLFTGFHPDGTISQQGNWYGGNHWLGTYRWVKSEQPSTEPFPAGDAQKSPHVWIAEFDYITEGIYHAQRYFDKQHQPVCATGLPLPERPAGVHPSAHFVDKSAQPLGISVWVMGQVDTRIGKYVGEYTEWDASGTCIAKRVFAPGTGEDKELHQYQYGKLTMSMLYPEPGVKVQSFYHSKIEPAVIQRSTLYRNNDKDCTYTYFDKTGKQLFEYRDEELSDLHFRRFYEGVLVYEGIQTADHEQAPVSIRYFYPDGTTLIDYTSKGDGTGTWQFYDKAGLPALSLPVDDEKNKNKYKHWDTFLRSSSDLKDNMEQPEWEAVQAAFKELYDKEILEATIANLPVPAFLKAELDKFDWDNMEVAMETTEDLPRYINGLFSEDEAIANSCNGPIWDEIEHQGSLYEATYAVGSIIANMLPHYAARPAIKLRLIENLFEILALPDVDSPKKLYKQLTSALQSSIQLFTEMTTDADEVIVLKALYLLIHAGQKKMSETAALFTQIWQHAENSLFIRSYAAFSLGDFYLRTKQEEKLVIEFSVALQQEQNTLLRLILAIHLVMATKKEAQGLWLAELIAALTNPEPIKKDFNELHPFVGYADVQEYIVAILGYANATILEKHIVPIIEMLPAANALKLETLLNTIFAVLFPNKAALKNITPVRKQALLTAADSVDKHGNFVNHMEIFRNYGLPHDALKLRQLATK